MLKLPETFQSFKEIDGLIHQKLNEFKVQFRTLVKMKEEAEQRALDMAKNVAELELENAQLKEKVEKLSLPKGLQGLLDIVAMKCDEMGWTFRWEIGVNQYRGFAATNFTNKPPL